VNNISLLGMIALAGVLIGLPRPGSCQTSSDPGANSSSDRLDDIVVTAQRRNENLQNVPIAITVVQGEDLAKSNFQQISDLQYLAPSVQFNPGSGGTFQIRGVGTQSYDFSNEQSVSVVVDDVVIDTQRDPGLIGLVDVQQVEVLRGPQGTLFGKNSTSGVIAITTAKPVLDEWSATVSASYGERNDRDVTGIVNIPMGATMALRLSAFEDGQDGYGRDTVYDTRIGTFHEEGARAKWLFEPTEDLEMLLLAEYAKHTDNSVPILTSASPPTVAAVAAAGTAVGSNNVNDADPYTASIDSQSEGVSLRVNYKLGAQTLTSISAYHRFTTVGDAPVDAAPTALYLPINIDVIHTNKISEEIRLASPTGQFLEYVAGLFYDRLSLNSTQQQWGTLGSTLPDDVYLAVTGAAGTNTNEDLFNSTNESKAVFGQIKLNFTNQFNLSLGARYTHDDNGQSFGFVTIPTSFVTVPLFAAPALSSGSVSHNNISYSIKPTYAFTPNLMAYLSYATGYKGPGVAFVSSIYDPYKAETVKSYEAGVKSEWFDQRVRLNADIFREDYTDFQAQTLVFLPGGGPGVYIIGNAGGMRSQGVETDITFRATSSLSLNGGITYAHSYFTNYVDGTSTYTNFPLTYAPRLEGNVAADYRFPVSSQYDVTAHANYSYRTQVYTVIAEPYSIVPGYGLLGGRIGFAPHSGPWQVGVYGRNILNKHFSSGSEQLGGVGTLSSTSLDEFRTIGVDARYSF
jgi:iron complex outermembrane receptor protein